MKGDKVPVSRAERDRARRGTAKKERHLVGRKLVGMGDAGAGRLVDSKCGYGCRWHVFVFVCARLQDGNSSKGLGGNEVKDEKKKKKESG